MQHAQAFPANISPGPTALGAPGGGDKKSTTHHPIASSFSGNPQYIHKIYYSQVKVDSPLSIFWRHPAILSIDMSSSRLNSAY